MTIHTDTSRSDDLVRPTDKKLIQSWLQTEINKTRRKIELLEAQEAILREVSQPEGYVIDVSARAALGEKQ